MEYSSQEELEAHEKILQQIEREEAQNKAMQANFLESVNNIGKEESKPKTNNTKRGHDKNDIINM